MTWNLNGTGTTPIITQEDSTSVTAATTQNGYGVGTLVSYSVLPDGTVQGPVSYTHLDVYKRQDQLMALPS